MLRKNPSMDRSTENVSMQEEEEEEEAEKETPLLRFGDYVSFFDAEHDGFMFTHLSGAPNSSLSVKPGTKRDLPGLGNFRDAVFQVLANNKYKAAKAYLRQMEALREENVGSSDEEILLEADPEVHQLKMLAEAEEADNILEQKRRHGDPVLYGQLIQLYHPLSGQYVHVSTTTTSKHEASMKVFLKGQNLMHCWFKIMPRYKVRTEGDYIRMNDQIVLESAKTPGQFLHSCASVLGPECPDRGCHEVNLSVNNTSFVVYPFRHDQADNHRFVKGGDVIQIFHKEINGYLAAEGNFSLSAPIEDVHLRIRNPDPKRPSRLFPPTSAVSFWQVEIQGAPWRGERVQWGVAVRLRHVPTQMYLILEASMTPIPQRKFTLSRDIMDPNGIFYFHPVVHEDSDIEFGSYARIQHAATKTWLHGAQNSPYERRGDFKHHESLDPDLLQRMTSIVWDPAPLVNITPSVVQMFDDAFILHPVAPHQVENVAFVVGMVPVLLQYVTDRRNCELFSHDTIQLADSLKQFKEFLFDSTGTRIKERQKLIRNLGVVEICVQMLQAPFKPFNTGASAIELTQISATENRSSRVIADAVYKFLKAYLSGNSRKNELYIAKHLPFFQTQLGSHLGVEKMYIDLVSDNAKIVYLLGDKEINHFIELLKQDKHPDYLQFLSVLCECDDVPILANQIKITKILLENPSGSLVYLTEINPNSKEVEVSIDGGKSWQSLALFAGSFSSIDLIADSEVKGGDSKKPSKKFLFLERQLDIFGKLCLGRCEYAIEVITKKLKYLTWEECFSCISNNSLPNSLRAIYVALVTSLFIDVGDNVDVLAEIKLIFDWEELSTDGMNRFPADGVSLSGASLPFFASLSNWITDYLGSIPYLVASNQDTNKMLEKVLQMLGYLVKFGYYLKPEQILALVRPLTVVLNGFTDIPLEAKRKDKNASLTYQPEQKVFFNEWQKKGRYLKNPQNKIIANVKYQALEIVASLSNYIVSLRLHHLLSDFKEVTQQAPRGRKASKVDSHIKTAHFRILHHFKEQIEMQEVLEQTDQVRAYLKALVLHTNWITPDWVLEDSFDAEFPQFVDILMDLAKYDYSKLVNSALSILDRIYSNYSNLFELAKQVQILIVPASVELSRQLDKQLPVVRRLGAGEIEIEEMKEFNTIIKELTNLCYLDGQNVPHSVNQSIIYNSGVLKNIYDVVEFGGQPREVLSTCFKFLRAMAVKHPIVQKELFDLLDRFFAVSGAEDGWQNDMAWMIAEIFTGYKELCMNIKSRHITMMMQMLATLTLTVSQMTHALEACMKIEEFGIPLKKNQGSVIKALMHDRARILSTALIDDSKSPEIAKQRLELLRSAPDDDPLLLYHLNIVSLFAFASEGENRFIESICQTIYNVDELLEILSDDRIPDLRKSPYLRFLLWVFLRTAGKPIEMGLGELHTKPSFWKALEATMNSRTVASYYTHRHPTNDELVFAFEGFIPLVAAVADRFYKPNEYRPSQRIFESIVLQVAHFSKRAAPTLFDKFNTKALAECLLSLSKVCAHQLEEGVVSLITSKLAHYQRQELESPAMQGYRQTYSVQIQTNDHLRQYVENLRRAHQGANLVSSQLPWVKVPKAVAARLFSEEEGSDEALPLGFEFQEFLDKFVLYEASQVELLSLNVVKSVSNVAMTGLNALTGARGTREAAGVKPDIKTLISLFSSYPKHNPTLSAAAKVENDRIVIKALQIIRGIVHNQVKLDRDFTKFQNSIAENSAVRPICALLSSNNDQVVREALACLIALLAGGNAQSQKNFADYFLGTREEIFFEDMQVRLRRAMENNRESRALRKQITEELKRRKDLISQQPQEEKLPVGMEAIHPRGSIPLQRLSQQDSEEDELLGLAPKDEGNIELVLRVLQLMCEGQNDVLQNYLHAQPDNMRSIDLVAETVNLLQVLTEEISPNTIDMVIQTLETLTEVSQGCQPNQNVTFDNHAVDYVNYIIRAPGFPGCYDSKVARLKIDCAKLVYTLLEDSSEETKSMALEVEETLDLSAVVKTMNDYHQIAISKGHLQWTRHPEEDSEPHHPLDVSFAYFNLLLRLSDFTGKSYREVRPLHVKGRHETQGLVSAPVDCSAYDDLYKQTVSIEFIRWGRIQKVYFLERWHEDLRPEVKQGLLWNVDRSSPSDKIRDFVERCRIIMADIGYVARVRNLTRVTAFMMKHSQWWGILLLMLTFAINICILAVWDAPDWGYENVTSDDDAGGSIQFVYLPAFDETLYGHLSSEHYHRPIDPSWYSLFLWILGGCHVFVSVVVSFLYFLVYPPSVRATLNSIPIVGEIIVDHVLPESASLQTRSSVFSFSCLYYLAVVAFSVAGLLENGYFFAFHLLHIVVNNDILLRVIQSVTKNGKSLLWVAALMVLLIYGYSLVMFAFYRNDLQAVQDDSAAWCQTSWQCFVITLDKGLLAGGGIGDAIGVSDTSSYHPAGVRVLLDLAFFLTINIIGLNVVFGIIVDTFSELRDEKYQIEEAMEGECFICSLRNYDFERFGRGFQEHVKKEHRMWNYLFFMLHLHEKDTTDYTSHEAYFSRMLDENQETALFPINRAAVLQSSPESEIEDRITSLEGALRELITRFDEEKRKTEDELRRFRQARWRRQQGAGPGGDAAPLHQLGEELPEDHHA